MATHNANDNDRQPITGAVCWRGADLGDSTVWTREFSTSEIDEIEVAVAANMDKSIEAIEREVFLLPTLAPELESVRHEIIEGRGFVLLRGLPVHRWSREVAARAYWGLGVHVGTPVSQNPEGHLLGHVKDIGSDFDDLNSRGGYRSRARLPFHTDVGADVVGLLCLRTAKNGGHSSVVSVAAIYNEMLERRPDLVDVLSSPFLCHLSRPPRRGPAGQKAVLPRAGFLLPRRTVDDNVRTAVYRFRATAGQRPRFDAPFDRSARRLRGYRQQYRVSARHGLCPWRRSIGQQSDASARPDRLRRFRSPGSQTPPFAVVARGTGSLATAGTLFRPLRRFAGHRTSRRARHAWCCANSTPRRGIVYTLMEDHGSAAKHGGRLL